MKEMKAMKMARAVLAEEPPCPIKVFGMDSHESCRPTEAAVAALIRQGLSPLRALLRAWDALEAVEAARILREAEEQGWPVGDSADPDWDGSGWVIQTRCAGGRHGHSSWAYGPVYTSREAAEKAEHRHAVECRCGYTGN